MLKRVCIAECDRCHTQTEVPVEDDWLPPVGWANTTLSIRGEATGWSAASSGWLMQLRPNCIAILKKVMKP